jgi:hypothetical protein
MPSPDLPILGHPGPRIGSSAGVRLREDTVYTNHKGEEKKSIRKRADKALAKLAVILRQVLEPDEVVLYLARGQAPVSAFEQITFGWYIYYVTGAVLVLTNRRLLQILVKRDGSWKENLRSLHWGDVAEAKVKGWLTPQLQLKYRNGKKATYWGLRREDSSKIKVLLEAVLPGSSGESTAAQSMVSLCPDCRAVLPPRVYRCSQCGLTFRDEGTMIRRSLLLPGGGYFYVGHAWLGVADFVVEAFLLAWALTWVLVAFGFPEPDLNPLEPATTPAEALVVAAVLGGLLAIEKLFTVYHCRRLIREFLPAREQVTSLRWPLYGLISALVVAGLVWAFVPERVPVTQVAPDLVLSQARFGLFGTDSYGNLQFSPSSVVPLQAGQSFGWVIRLKTPRDKVRLREEIVLPPPISDRLPSDEPSLSSPESLAEGQHMSANEEEMETEKGVIYRFWTIDAEDVPGNYTIRLFDGVLVQTFAFEMR